ncbi:hypothetical protein V7114_18355 [Neobacillus niacini]|uniref:hypothetical protein n=1 Tax=Neobacillus niacini TaxID=86668 RepID=UPI002FFF9181
MDIENVAARLQEELSLVEINFDKEVLSNYYYIGKKENNKIINLRYNTGGSVFVKVNHTWKPIKGLLITDTRK